MTDQAGGISKERLDDLVHTRIAKSVFAEFIER